MVLKPRVKPAERRNAVCTLWIRCISITALLYVLDCCLLLVSIYRRAATEDVLENESWWRHSIAMLLLTMLSLLYISSTAAAGFCWCCNTTITMIACPSWQHCRRASKLWIFMMLYLKHLSRYFQTHAEPAAGISSPRPSPVVILIYHLDIVAMRPNFLPLKGLEISRAVLRPVRVPPEVYGHGRKRRSEKRRQHQNTPAHM